MNPQEDTYTWLRSKHWQHVLEDPNCLEEAIRDFLEKENIYFLKNFEPVETLRKEIFEEIKNRIPGKDRSISLPHGTHTYWTSYEGEGYNYPIFWQDQKVILDVNHESRDKKYFHVEACYHSDDHKTVVWAYDTVGDESYALLMRSIETGLDNPKEKIEKTSGHVVWDALNQGFFYVALDERHHPSRVFYHKVGTSPQEDHLVFIQENPAYFVSLYQTQSGDYIIIDSSDHDSNESFFLSRKNPLCEPRLFSPRQNDCFYKLDYCPERHSFFVLTNDQAFNFKVIEKFGENFDEERQFIPHNETELLLEHVLYKNFHVCLSYTNANPKLTARSLLNDEIIEILPPENVQQEVYDITLIEGYDYETPLVYFSYSALNVPKKTYAFHLEKKQITLLKEEDIPTEYNGENYSVKRLWAPAHDGENIPISLVMKKDIQLPAPCLLYGYGAYGFSVPGSFRRDIISLLDRGFIYAIAHSRGGKERGGKWYKEGKFLKKKNTFLDFLACAHYLHERGYTKPEILAAHGGSAGGMLMGAIANMRPDLFSLICAEVPFVDVLNTICDATLPLTPPEWEEWGNPLEDQIYFDYIKSYCPYQNVVKQPYPHIVALTSVADPRVGYWEAAKWVAKLRDHSTSDKPILLKVNMTSAGHFGASGRYRLFEDRTYLYAYCAHHLLSRAS